jgi:hypothetical protein
MRKFNSNTNLYGIDVPIEKLRLHLQVKVPYLVNCYGRVDRVVRADGSVMPSILIAKNEYNDLLSNDTVAGGVFFDVLDDITVDTDNDMVTSGVDVYCWGRVDKVGVETINRPEAYVWFNVASTIANFDNGWKINNIVKNRAAFNVFTPPNKDLIDRYYIYPFYFFKVNCTLNLSLSLNYCKSLN